METVEANQVPNKPAVAGRTDMQFVDGG